MTISKFVEKKVVVIGATVADITGFSSKPLIFGDSNPGQVKFSSGGVGRNIAENLARLDCNVELITAFGDDIYAQALMSHCEASGVNIDKSLFLPKESSAIYLSINNPEGNMAMAVSDTAIIDEISPDFIASRLSSLKEAHCIVLDTNLREDTLDYISKNYLGKALFIDLVSTTKAKKVSSIMGRFHTLKPNLMEAEYLTGITVKDPEDLHKMHQIFIDKGIHQVFISQGEDGCFYGDAKGYNSMPTKKSAIVNSSGAGDAFMAGLVFGYLNDFDIKETATFATCMSLAALQSEEAVNPELSLLLVNSIRQEL